MISHFLLNLQNISTRISNGSNLSHPSFVRSTQEQVSSIHFVDNVIGNLGASLREGSLDDELHDEDPMDMNGGTETNASPHVNAEMHVVSSSGAVDITEENRIAGPSRVHGAETIV